MNTLVRLGTAVAFEGEDGVRFAVRGAMLYADDGRAWPRNSILIASFDRHGTVVEDPTPFARKWHDGEWREGQLALPPRELSGWSDGQAVRKIEYDRAPTREGMEHSFGGLGGFLGRLIPVRFFGTLPRLYRRAGMCRLEPVTVGPGGIIAP